MSDRPRFELRIDRQKCVGHGRCYDVAPQLFAPGDDEGRARVLRKEVAEDQLDLALVAVKGCPEEAVLLLKPEGPEEAAAEK